MDVVLDEIEECVPDKSSVEDIVETKELQELLNAFLKSLPERDCNIFLRRFWYVEEYAEIAERYDLNINTVKSSVFRTRAKLKDFLEKEGVTI